MDIPLVHHDEVDHDEAQAYDDGDVQSWEGFPYRAVDVDVCDGDAYDDDGAASCAYDDHPSLHLLLQDDVDSIREQIGACDEVQALFARSS